ncbi:site-specific tyrosine recombinase XerC [Paraburkholderia pallida]|uniref:Site-specific tyrosine recombinase XerC n=2 Tax=Paraburkholderia pallida TaxID=2547399 RepID=A0A4P7CZZ7_9BURK|nr:site-specific tyrosine recombinase XerC [Paraburkholderia pallida]
MKRHLEWLLTRNYSVESIRLKEGYLRQFIQWCDERGVGRPQEVTRAVLERYQRHLYLYRKKDGQPLSGYAQHQRLTPIRVWFRWLVRQHRILSNPAADLEMPRIEQRLPRHILSVPEAEQILAVPDVTSAMGLRDRAILETLYSTGIRRLELVSLEVHDIDHERGTLMVREGKGKRDRMVPVGDRALAWIRKYLDEVRPQLMLGDDNPALFLSIQGEAIGATPLGHLVREYIRRSGLQKSGACHLFRHTMATLMLENGADVRFVQAMLGHADLKTTQVYTHVAIRALKEIHTATHPARLERAGETTEQKVTRLRQHEYIESSRRLFGMAESRKPSVTDAPDDTAVDGDAPCLNSSVPVGPKEK